MAKQIQWFPGHMSKALRQIEEKLPVVDVVVELVDARAPLSSRNPKLDKIAAHKLRVIVMTKKDLADINAVNKWIEYFKSLGYEAVCVDLGKNEINPIKASCKKVMEAKFAKEKAKGLRPRAIRALICGIPNVGKSTLINKFAKRKATIVENRPGVTKSQQWIKVDKEFELLDTPGVLWPSFEDEKIGTRLSLLCTIK